MKKKDWLLINMLGKRSEVSKLKKKFKLNYNEGIIKKLNKIFIVVVLREINYGMFVVI